MNFWESDHHFEMSSQNFFLGAAYLVVGTVLPQVPAQHNQLSGQASASMGQKSEQCPGSLGSSKELSPDL